MAELADAQRSGRCLGNQVQVRILPRALWIKKVHRLLIIYLIMTGLANGLATIISTIQKKLHQF